VTALVGRTIEGRYKLLELLGEGGMGTVYRALQLSMDREVAVKVLKPELAGDETSVARFFREVKSGSALNHPNIVTIFDFGRTEEKLTYMAMELLVGRTLARLVVREHPSVKTVCVIIAQVCDALVAAHEAGIIHRDLKPANIFVVGRLPDMQVKVVDFGIAKLVETGQPQITQTGALCGTPGYMSPEQASGEELDARSDLYSVGVILFELLTGMAPFQGASPVEVLIKHLHEIPPPLEELLGEGAVPVGLSDLVRRCLAKRPADRPQTATYVGRVMRELAAVLDDRDRQAESAIVREEQATTKVERVSGWPATGTTAQGITRLTSPGLLTLGDIVLGRYQIADEV